MVTATAPLQVVAHSAVALQSTEEEMACLVAPGSSTQIAR